MKFMKYLILILGFGSPTWAMEIDHYKNVIFKQSDLDKPLFSKNKLLPTKNLEAVLIKYKVALESLRDALIQLNEEVGAKNLVSFDPHVGDTCCEIRAFILASSLKETIYHQVCSNEEWLSLYVKNIEEILSKIKKIIEVKLNDKESTFAIFEPNATYRTFFDNYKLNLNFEVTDEIRYLQLCYFLTQARITAYSFEKPFFTGELLTSAHIKDSDFGLSINSFKDLVHSSQAELSKISIKQIQKELDNLYVLSEEFKADLVCALGAEGCCLSPGMDSKELGAYFPMLVVLYASALQKGIPIVLRVLKFSKEPKGFTRIYQLFIPDTENFAFKAVELNDAYDVYKDSIALDLHALSFDGSYEEFEEFLKTSSSIPFLPSLTESSSFEICLKN